MLEMTEEVAVMTGTGEVTEASWVEMTMEEEGEEMIMVELAVSLSALISMVQFVSFVSQSFYKTKSCDQQPMVLPCS